MAEDAEAAMAAAELDGNRPRKVNPLTIIQVTQYLMQPIKCTVYLLKMYSYEFVGVQRS